METLAEFLKHNENQVVVLERIIELLRSRGEWGQRGLFAKIRKATKLSPAYVGRMLNGKQALTDTFMMKIATYLRVTQDSLRGETTGYQELVINLTPDQFENVIKTMIEQGYTDVSKKSVADYLEKLLIKNSSTSM